jgi:hypothetical protein
MECQFFHDGLILKVKREFNAKAQRGNDAKQIGASRRRTSAFAEFTER